MEKRREIPPKKPNAAPRADVDRVLRRIDQLGFGGEESVERAGFARATYFRLKRYEASVGTVRSIEEWAVKEEGRQRKPSTPTGPQEDALLKEWSDLGERLLAADPGQFTRTLEGLRDMVESLRLQQQAILKMFRANPEQDR